MRKNVVMLSSSPLVGKSLREIYDLHLNRDHSGWWVAVEPHPKSSRGVMESPVLAISPSIDLLVEFCKSRKYFTSVTYEPIMPERPAGLDVRA